MILFEHLPVALRTVDTCNFTTYLVVGKLSAIQDSGAEYL